MTDLIARRLRITGRVQGVGYRDWFVRVAQGHDIRGWVRNREDGSVEALCAGEEKRINAMVALAYQGPPLARVEDIRISDAQGIVAADFRRLPTV